MLFLLSLLFNKFYCAKVKLMKLSGNEREISWMMNSGYKHAIITTKNIKHFTDIIKRVGIDKALIGGFNKIKGKFMLSGNGTVEFLQGNKEKPSYVILIKESTKNGKGKKVPAHSFTEVSINKLTSNESYESSFADSLIRKIDEKVLDRGFNSDSSTEKISKNQSSEPSSNNSSLKKKNKSESYKPRFTVTPIKHVFKNRHYEPRVGDSSIKRKNRSKSSESSSNDSSRNERGKILNEWLTRGSFESMEYRPKSKKIKSKPIKERSITKSDESERTVPQNKTLTKPKVVDVKCINCGTLSRMPKLINEINGLMKKACKYTKCISCANDKMCSKMLNVSNILVRELCFCKKMIYTNPIFNDQRSNEFPNSPQIKTHQYHEEIIGYTPSEITPNKVEKILKRNINHMGRRLTENISRVPEMNNYDIKTVQQETPKFAGYDRLLQAFRPEMIGLPPRD